MFDKKRKPETSAEASKLADDYIVARKEDATNAKDEEEKNAEKRGPAPRWSKGRKNGHLMQDGRQGQVKTGTEKTKMETPRRPRKDLKNREYFNCHEKGHYAFHCPKEAHFCKDSREMKKVTHCVNKERKGLVEGTS